MKKNKVPFRKYSGAGNDFVIIDNRKIKILKKDKKKIVEKICNRNFGVGADGALFLEPSKKADFSWDFYNQDGSFAEMCINASRCVTAFGLEMHKKNKIRFETHIGILEGKKNGPLYSVQVPQVITHATNKTLRVLTSEKDIQVKGFFVNTGVPHFVVEKNDIPDDEAIYAALRFHESFGKSGSNITIWSQLSGGKIKAATYERGVEGFTLACGTGAAAVAAMMLKVAQKKKTKVQMPGGEISIEIFDKHYTATGPAILICDGEFFMRGTV